MGSKLRKLGLFTELINEQAARTYSHLLIVDILQPQTGTQP